MSHPDITHTYLQRTKELETERKSLKKKRDVIAWSRFFILLAAIAAFFFLRPYGLSYALITSSLLVAIFLRLIVLSARNNETIINIEQLLLINRRELNIINGQYAD